MSHILLIEDEATLREVMSRMLTRAGYTVISVEDGSAALRLMSQQIPDVVITDVFMPGRDGISTIMELRKDHESVPILAMSGGGEIGYVSVLNMAEALGATAILAKPFDGAQLLAVQQLLAQSATSPAGTSHA